MPWGAIIGGAVSLYSASEARDDQQGATKANGALADRQFEEDKRRYDLNREDQERWGMMTINGEEEFDRRNRADAEKAYQRSKSDKEEAYQRVRGDNLGTINRGEAAGNQLSYLMGLGGTGTGEAGSLNRNFTNEDFIKDPGYEFRMSEGERGQNNSLAAQGGLLSGAAMKALERYRQGFASNEYDKAYARFGNNQSNQYGRLAGIQGAGQNAINTTAGMNNVAQFNPSGGSAGSGGSGIASGLNSASAQFGQSSNNYFKNLMDNNTASANANAAYNVGQGKNIVNGLNSVYNGWQQNDVMAQIQNKNRNNNSNAMMYANDWTDV